MPRNIIESKNAPAAVGPYSQAVWHGDTLFLSGQTPLVPETGVLASGDIGAQTEQAFRNIKAVLSEAGLSLENAVKLTVYLTSMDDFKAMNAVYEQQLSPPYPARTTIAVAALPVGASVEIEVVAKRG